MALSWPARHVEARLMPGRARQPGLVEARTKRLKTGLVLINMSGQGLTIGSNRRPGLHAYMPGPGESNEDGET